MSEEIQKIQQRTDRRVAVLMTAVEDLVRDLQFERQQLMQLAGINQNVQAPRTTLPPGPKLSRQERRKLEREKKKQAAKIQGRAKKGNEEQT